MSVVTLKHKDWKIRNKLACFDLDYTLVFPIRGPYKTDIILYKDVNEYFENLTQNNYSIVIFSNQMKKSKQEVIEKFENFQNQVKVPLLIMGALFDDVSRKPNIGMWEMIRNHCLKKNPEWRLDSSSFFCGDSAGRPYDYSDSDLIFAKNCGLTFYYPEDLFPPTVIKIKQMKTLIVMVGEPGCGKTHWCTNSLEPLGFVILSSDVLVTKTKLIESLKQAILEELPVAIDSTNFSENKRQEYYNLVKFYEYDIVVVHIMRAGNGQIFLEKNRFQK